MNITIFGATGSLGSECLNQAIEAGHNITLLIRDKTKMDRIPTPQLSIFEGNGLDIHDVEQVISTTTDAVLFAVGVKKDSPADLCTLITKNILDVMNKRQIKRFVFCSGANLIVAEDKLAFGMKFVVFFAKAFMGNKHFDKYHQFELLGQYPSIDWLGIRPVQIIKGPLRSAYQIGYIPFSGFSQISFADCAHEMLQMITDDTWLRKIPVIHY